MPSPSLPRPGPPEPPQAVSSSPRPAAPTVERRAERVETWSMGASIRGPSRRTRRKHGADGPPGPRTGRPRTGVRPAFGEARPWARSPVPRGRCAVPREGPVRLDVGRCGRARSSLRRRLGRTSVPPRPLLVRTRACALLASVALLGAGCGGGSAVPADPSVTVDPGGFVPTADAGANTVGRVNTLVTLDGRASKDPEGGALTFRWVQAEGPTVPFSSVTDAQPTFTPTVAGTYVFDLLGDDDTGLESSPSTVTVVVIDDLAPQPRRAPAAVARAAGLRHAAFLAVPPAPLPPAVLLADGLTRNVQVVDLASDPA